MARTQRACREVRKDQNTNTPAAPVGAHSAVCSVKFAVSLHHRANQSGWRIIPSRGDSCQRKINHKNTFDSNPGFINVVYSANTLEARNMVITQNCNNCGAEIEFEAESPEPKSCPRCGISNRLPPRPNRFTPLPTSSIPQKEYRERYVCTVCHTVSDGAGPRRGWITLEIFLWCCGLVPGLLYSAWRGWPSSKRCGSCGASSMIPVSTPLGKSIVFGSDYGNKHGNAKIGPHIS